MSLATYDLFTDEEHEIYAKMISLMNEIDRLGNLPKQDRPEDCKQQIKQMVAEKKSLTGQLAAVIQRHRGTPRRVRLANVLDLHKFRDEDGQLHLPPGITWWTLKMSKRIAEFESEESRAMGLKRNEITFDKIIVKWKSLDVLEQIVMDGFIMPLLHEDGSVTEKRYRFHTASAGQLAC